MMVTSFRGNYFEVFVIWGRVDFVDLFSLGVAHTYMPV